MSTSRGKGPDPLGLVELAAITEEVTSVLRHDLRNRLSSIRNASFYVKRRVSKTDVWTADPRLEQMTTEIDLNVVGANALLEQPGEHLHRRAPVPIDARLCVLRAVENARVARPAQIQVGATSGRTYVDPAELALAVRCIVENAVQATGDEGVVHVLAGALGGSYRIEVLDEGPGIADAQREDVLQPFFTTKPGCAGLGLNIARRIVKRYGGKLVVGSHAPTGASVAITLELIREGEDGDDRIG